jgi:hypothetical protein
LRLTALVAGVAMSGLCAANAFAATCGLCNTDIVMTSELAECFLKDYQTFASVFGEVVVVDLTSCETSRGGLEALPGPTRLDTTREPDTQFMIPRAQLDCLKKKLEEPGLVLDPSTRIELASCG